MEKERIKIKEQAIRGNANAADSILKIILKYVQQTTYSYKSNVFL